jgi:AcrR family transcriptional regulator
MPTVEHRFRPRKIPRQERARETRTRILGAAREVFAAHGYAAGTTNRIADAAGMSVGSLYQYFPNKDAILVELVGAHVADGARRIAPLLAGAHGRDVPITATLRAVVSEMVDIHLQDRRLHRVLFEESPRPATLLAELHATEDRLVALVAGLLRDHDVVAPDVDLAARITVTAVESLVHRMVTGAAPIDPELFVDEVVRLVAGYLGVSSGRAASRARRRGA